MANSKWRGDTILPFRHVYGASAAYSLRKLRTAYTGAAIRVRRSSDNTTLDVGFKADGTLDTTSMLSFVGAGNGFVSIWYDQSGNSRNLTQVTSALQPLIMDAGSIKTLNGKTTLVTSSQYMKVDFGTTISQPISIFNIGSHSNAINGIISNFTSTGYVYSLVGNTNLSAGVNLSLSYSASISTQRLMYLLANSTKSRIAINGTSGTSGNSGTNGLNGLTLSANPDGTFSNGQNHQELILWNANKTTDRTGIESNINSFYTIY